MAVDDAKRFDISSYNLGTASSTILVTDAVEAVATNALLKPAIGTGIDHRFLWEVTVIGGVEDGNLGNIDQGTFNCLNPFEILRIMQWRKRCKVLNFGF